MLKKLWFAVKLVRSSQDDFNVTEIWNLWGRKTNTHKLRDMEILLTKRKRNQKGCSAGNIESLIAHNQGNFKEDCQSKCMQRCDNTWMRCDAIGGQLTFVIKQVEKLINWNAITTNYERRKNNARMSYYFPPISMSSS